MRRCMHIYCFLHCRCNLSALQHSINRFDRRLGQRIAHADDDAIALTARRLPRRKRARCMCVCVWATRFACGREQSLPRAWDSQATHLAINPHAQCSAMDPRAASPRCNSRQAQHRADRCHALCEQCQRNHNRKTARLHRLELSRARAHIIPPIYTARLSLHLRAHI